MRTLKLAVLSVLLISCQNESAIDKIKSAPSDAHSNKLQLVEHIPNKEWQKFKNHYHHYSFHFKIGDSLFNKNFELRLIQFKDGIKVSDFVIDKGVFGLGTSKEDSLLSIYLFKHPNLYSLEYTTENNVDKSITLSLLSDDPFAYRATDLYSKSSIDLLSETTTPIVTLTMPYIERCDPEACYYCILPDHINTFETWGTTLNIKHYYIITLTIT